MALLRELRPRALLLENVPGLNQLAGGAVRRQIEEDLSLGGAYVVVSGVLDAGDFGAPQRRPRLVFIGAASTLGEPELPEGTGVTALLRNGHSGEPHARVSGGMDEWLEALGDPWDDRAVTASQALSDLIHPGDAYTSEPRSAYQRKIRRDSDAPQDHIPSQIRDDTAARLKAIPPGGNVYDLPEHLLARYIAAVSALSMRRRARAETKPPITPPSAANRRFLIGAAGYCPDALKRRGRWLVQHEAKGARTAAS